MNAILLTLAVIAFIVCLVLIDRVGKRAPNPHIAKRGKVFLVEGDVLVAIALHLVEA